MKLHWSPRSPQVRKVMIVVHELGLADRIRCVRTVVDPTTPNVALMEDNPLLVRLKELETLEKIAEKVDKITVGSFDTLLNSLVPIGARDGK